MRNAGGNLAITTLYQTYKSRWFRCLPAAVLSVAAQKVPKEAAQRGVERLAPARRATPPRPPQARYVVFANMHLTSCCSACNFSDGM